MISMNTKMAFVEIKDGYYDCEEMFYSADEAIKRALMGEDIAVLDALSLEYFGQL